MDLLVKNARLLVFKIIVFSFFVLFYLILIDVKCICIHLHHLVRYITIYKCITSILVK